MGRVDGRRWSPLLAALLAIPLIGCGDDLQASVEPAADDGVWRKLPRVALGWKHRGPQELTAHQVGSAVVIIVGSSYNQTPVGALRYDLGVRRWRKLPSAPLRWRVGYGAAAVGDDIVVWGGTSNTGNLSDGARYDVAARRWTKLPPSPLRARYYHSAVSTGEEVIFFGGSRKSGGSRTGAMYTPASDSWSRIAPAPLAGRRNPIAVWSGREMIVWGGYALERGEPEGFFADGAAFDPTTAQWRLIADAPLHAGEYAFGLWAGDRLFVFNGSRAALYDPASDEWRLAAEPPVPEGIYEGAWTGERALVWGTRIEEGDGAHGAAYDPTRDAWTPLPKAPLRAWGHQVTLWTGQSLFIWGGCCRGDAVIAGGAEYLPAAGR